MKRLLVFALLCVSACLAQGPKILIVTDMEGLGGVNDRDEQLLPGQRRYEETRRILTGEVNAAVQGAKDAGASLIVIWDGHDGSRSLAVDEVLPPARLIQGKPTPANYYMGPKMYDGIIFIGQHAMAGDPKGVLAHSQSSATIKQITLNGKPVGELGQVAAIGGYFDIPVIMLTGDEAACQEMLALQPTAVTVAVKKLVGKQSTLSLPHAEAKSLIEQAARQAVRQVKSYQSWKLQGPVDLMFEYSNPAGKISHFQGQTVLEAFEGWLGKP